MSQSLFVMAFQKSRIGVVSAALQQMVPHDERAWLSCRAECIHAYRMGYARNEKARSSNVRLWVAQNEHACQTLSPRFHGRCPHSYGGLRGLLSLGTMDLFKKWKCTFHVLGVVARRPKLHSLFANSDAFGRVPWSIRWINQRACQSASRLLSSLKTST
jgi:hypothetical protein